MKRGIFAFFILTLVGMNFVAGACSLDVSLVNQDPYPAIPGDYVKLVFQVNGVSNPECSQIDFRLLDKYPLSFDPGENNLVSINSGIYHNSYSSFLLAPYKVRVDEDALDGDNPIEVQYQYGLNEGYESKQFDLNVEDTRADFEVHIKDYNPTTKILTFEILNVADQNIEALTVDVPKQQNIDVKGSNINIVGDLDSNEYTTADFEATPSKGNITLDLTYTDTINKRRSLQKTVFFDPEYFKDRASDKKSSFTKYLILLFIVGIAYYFWRKSKKKKRKRLK